MNDEPEWVELRRFDDALECDIAANFLRDHGVTVALRGNSGATSVLNRFTTVFDMRLTVPVVEFDRACEVLEALASPDQHPSADPGDPGDPGDHPYHGADGVPYRGARPVADEAPLVQRRSGVMSAFVALILPIGAGHFYARHNTAGQVFCAGVLGFFFGGAARGLPWFSLAAMFIVLANAVGSVAAVRRFNAGRVPSPGRQAAGALAACLGCAVVAWAVRGGR